MKLRIAISVLLATGLLFPGAEAQEPPSRERMPEKIQFNRDIRPILSENCFKCHGPDAKGRKGDLRLDTREGAFAEVDKGKFALVSGNPAKSELWARVTTADPDDLMPPAKTGKKLTKHQIALIRKWIEQGAVWQNHWAFIPPKPLPPPTVRRADWPKNEIDAFILARLEEEGLTPSAEADRMTLVRRLSLDLTGLPPTPQEADAFVHDSSPQAYERLVDRLLASPRYGEHMGRYWLDLARYGDTHGLHLDNYREMWPYRDWVLRAFNENLPFDKFITDQLAGDLVPDGGLDDEVASGFNRCHITTNEGGSIEEEVYCRNVFDRVETFAQVYLALSFTCCRCHDHKYDPLKQKEYYQLFAFFNSLDGSEMDGNKKDPAPVVRVPTAEDRARLAKLGPETKEIEAKIAAPVPDLDAAQARWESDFAAKLRDQWRPLTARWFGSQEGSGLRRLPDQSILSYGTNPAKDVVEAVFPVDARAIQAIRLEALADPSLPGGGTGRASNSNFVLSTFEAEVRPLSGGPAKKIAFEGAQADVEQKDFDVARAIDGKGGTGWAVESKKENHWAVFFPKEPVAVEGGAELHVTLRFDHGDSHAIGRFRVSVTSDGELLRAAMPVKFGEWSSIGPFKAATAAEAFRTAYPPEKEVDLKKKYEDGKLGWQRRPRWTDGVAQNDLVGENCATYLTRTIAAATAREITVSLGSDDTITLWLNGRQILSNEAYRGVAPDQEKAVLPLKQGENRLLLKICNGGGGYGYYFKKIGEQLGGVPAAVAKALDVAAEKRSGPQKDALREYYRREHWPEWKTLDARRAALREEERQIQDRAPTTLVFKERKAPREAFILKRGEYDRRGDKVDRGTPGVLPPLPAGAPVDRLGLARWLLEPGNPLTARVVVNRFWQQCFGTGIVKTAEDFGLQGEPPSHPELLDWLALRFVDDGWDVKRMMKRLLMSATYRQASRVSPELVRRDPENRLLARGPRFRLDAEVLRDQALQAAGLLVEKLGGPSVKPPQPEGLWEAVGYSGSNTVRFTRDLEPDKVFRRSLYIFWKRTSSPPQMSTLDAPSRESCTVRRERTNTPLQALLLMNGPQYVEAARRLAERAMKEGGADLESKATFIFREAAIRPPDARDLETLTTLYRQQLESYRARPEAAKKLIATGDTKPDPALDPAELAAWSMVANVILNLDEVITKG